MEKTKKLFKIEDENLVVEYEVLPLIDDTITTDPRLLEINQGLNSVEERLNIVQDKLDNLNSDIDRLTNHADGFDYMLAVASGIIAGIFDYFKMGEFSLKGANEFGQSKVEEIIKNVAKKKAEERGYTGNVDSLEGAVRFLEDKFTIAADTVTDEFGGGKQHHLRDFSHHASPTGVIFSLLTQFTGKVYGTDTTGAFQAIPLAKEGTPLVGNSIFEKFTYGIINWFFHMISDVAGASTSIRANSLGTGLPGPILSMLKEFSTLPIFNKLDKNGNKEFSVWISKLFNGTLLAKRDDNGKLIPDTVVPFDLRTEIGIAHYVGKQAIPVIMNECIVRGFYFLRRLYLELRDKKIGSIADLERINWKATLPHNNRTISRMLTIATGTFTSINLAGAAINAVRKPGGLSNIAMFFSYFILRVNFVGVGRFAVACYTDIKMGIERSKLIDERMKVNSEIIFLNNAKVFYMQAEGWIAAENASIAIEKSYNLISETTNFFNTTWNDITESINVIGKCINKIEEKNPGMKKKMLVILDRLDRY